MRTTIAPVSALASSRTALEVRGGATFSRARGSTRPGLARRAAPAYLKALRSAELAAWNAARPSLETSGDPLRRAQAELGRQRRSERWFFGLIGIIAALAIAFGFGEPLRLADHWADFVRLVQQVAG